ncbi:hypothetical protein EXIGLDRAFT_735763 [Exidia glandulosa HHB12029]|uniref:Uncharacterized protein n=1 Tax=Exidia glandulosa HHB12029 TaxID=1314781 RepID=A0A165PKB3_EXIGL|nr:hypothetical protein EXIGLDRAFT_735763 [Exidia glandulosa HHB12029]
MHLPLLSSVVLLSLASVRAQEVNGQYFTRGLAIVDAPNPGSPYNAGGNMPIAVDVSGNGQLAAQHDTSLDTLTIFLVSSALGTNYTVVANATFLQGEEGSTVKHLDWQVPSCVGAGSYNLTFYETAKYQGTAYFAITPIPVEIKTPSSSAACTNGQEPTKAEVQPQADNAYNAGAGSPFLPGNAAATQTGAGLTLTGQVPVLVAFLCTAFGIRVLS